MSESLVESGNGDNDQKDNKFIVDPPIVVENNFEPDVRIGTETYGLEKVAIFYLVLSILYIISDLVVTRIEEITLFTGSFAGGLMVLCFILYLIIRNSIRMNNYNGNFIHIFIIFSIFKLTLFFFLSYMEKLFLNEKPIPMDYDYIDDFLSAPFILFANAALSIFYIGLIIYSNLTSVKLLYVSLIGLGACVIAFAVLFPVFNIILAGIVVGIIFVEVVLLIISLYITQHNDLLEDSKSINNIIFIDYYKYLPLMVVCYIMVIICIYIGKFVVYLIKEICTSRATYVDEEGHVYDQCHNRMGISLPKKPSYVTEDGKFYDKNNNEIIPSPDCQIF